MQLTIFDALMGLPPSGSSTRTCPDSTASRTTRSVPSWADWSAVMQPSSRYQSADGPVLVWFLDPAEAPHGGSVTPSTTAWPSDGTASLSSLAEVLEHGDHLTPYCLSSKACLGILRRAEKRGKKLPAALQRALRAAAGLDRHSAETTRGGAIEVATACNAKGGSGRMDFETETFVTHALKAEGFDASEDGTGRGVPLVPMTIGALGASMGGVSGKDSPQVVPKPGDPCHPLAAKGRPPAIAYRTTGNDGCYETGEVVGALNTATDQNQSVVTTPTAAVRRLTPCECEALQGFPRGYTDVPYRKKKAADGPRYRALGNSIAVPVLHAVGAGIERVRRQNDPCG